MSAVEPKHTPISTQEYLTSCRNAFQKVFDSEPTNETIALLWAHWALETGRGKNCFNYNLGNVKCFDPSQPYHMLRNIWEIENGQKVFYQPPHKQTWFRAYQTLDEGMEAYLKLIYHRFNRSVPALLNGNAGDFATSLKVQHYFTGNLGDYISALTSLQKEFLKTSKSTLKGV